MSYFQARPVSDSQGINFDMFVPGTSNPSIPQEHYRPEAAGPRFVATDGFFGDLTPTRPDTSDLPTGVLLVAGIVVVGAIAAFLFTGADEPRKAF